MKVAKVNSALVDIRPIDLVCEREEAFLLLLELREKLTQTEFDATLAEAGAADGYRLVGAFVGSAERKSLVGLMGYRILTDFVHGRHLYIDDLVVTRHARSGGIGAAVLSWAEKEAKRLGILRLRLCTGVDNVAGKKFYEREGWVARAVAFKKQVELD